MCIRDSTHEREREREFQESVYLARITISRNGINNPCIPRHHFLTLFFLCSCTKQFTIPSRIVQLPIDNVFPGIFSFSTTVNYKSVHLYYKRSGNQNNESNYSSFCNAVAQLQILHSFEMLYTKLEHDVRGGGFVL